MTKKNRVATGGNPSVVRTLWAYGYEMVPPHPEDQMADIRDLIDRQNRDAAGQGRTWTARLVTRHVAHVMVVSTSPDLDLGLNRRLEAELSGLGVHYLMTVPMRVTDEPDAGV